MPYNPEKTELSDKAKHALARNRARMLSAMAENKELLSEAQYKLLLPRITVVMRRAYSRLARADARGDYV